MKRASVLLIILAFVMIGLSYDSLMAAGRGGWNEYKSETGLWRVEMPGEVEVIEHKLRVSPNYEVYSEEVTAVIDQREYRNVLKTFSVMTEQTWGPGYNARERAAHLKKDLEKDLQLMKESGGKLIEVFEEKNGVFVEYFYSYNDAVLGEQGIKTRIYFSNTMRIRQTLSGPVNFIDNKGTDRFFDSLAYKKGYFKNVSQFADWENEVSPLGLFTVPYPPQNGLYFPNKPKVTNDGKRESVALVFYDPIQDQHMFYTVYGYEFEGKVSDALAQRVMAKYHIAKYNPLAKDIRFQAFEKDGIPIFEREEVLSKTFPKAPYVNTARIRGQYKDNKLVVQEIVGGHNLTRANFSQYLMNMLEFTPNKTVNAVAPDTSSPENEDFETAE